MAIDVCCEIASLVTSPRISFSHDDDGIPIEECHYTSTIDFDFCVTDDKQLMMISSADELFSNGKILPFQPTPPLQKQPKSFQKQPKSLQKQPQETTKKSLKEFLSTDLDDDDDDDDEHIEKLPQQAKPFWQFRRSSSLNYQNSQNNRFLHFLTRSNSTGSAPTQKTPKIYQKQCSQRALRKSSSLSSSSSSSSSSTSSSFASSFNQSHPLHSSSSKKGQSHPLKKSYSTRSYGGNGVHVSPVLNIPHGYISKGTICLFGLGSFLCNGKSKKNK